MTFARLSEAWMRFWFTPTSPSPICLYRIFYGLAVMACAVLWLPDALTWFGHNGPIEPHAGQHFLGGLRINPLLWFKTDDTMVLCLLGALIITGLFVTVGLCTRASLIAVWLLLVTFQTRNPFIMNVGDDFLRIAGFLLVFSPAGKMYSLDSYFKSRFPNGRRTASPLQSECVQAQATPVPWAQRLLQIQIAAMYFQAFFAKLGGDSWWNGSAVYTITHVGGFGHFAMPAPIDTMLTYQIITWSTLLIELSMWTLIWFKECRYFVLLLGLSMHVGIDVFMSLPMLVYYFAGAYAAFLYPTDVEQAIDAVKRNARNALGLLSQLPLHRRGRQHV